jgi:type I restriction enzyme S subunit
MAVLQSEVLKLGVPILVGSNISENHIEWAASNRITIASNELLTASQLAAGDLVMVRVGEPGVAAVVPPELDGCNCASMMIVRQGPSFDSQWLCHAMNSKHGRRQVAHVQYGTAQKQFNISDAIDFLYPFPSLPEQRAIATALNDVDALLGGLDRLIAKKRDFKQAAMQQLLTGQTRLPGFSGEWEMKRLGDHVTFLRNGVNSRAELLPEGRVRYLHYGDIHASTDSFLSPRALPSLPEAKAAQLDRLRDGDVIFADASEDIAGVCKSVELRGVHDTEVVSGLHTIAARFDKTVIADGFKGFLQYCPSFATHLRRLAAGTKVYATNRAHIASVEMRLPSVVEQTAIATVLSDMDAELAALEARRDKTRDLKQAMMQELLTGRTRLV